MRFIIDIPEGSRSGIYRIKNNKDGRVYIGRTKNFDVRAAQHKYNFETGRCNWKIGLMIKQHPDIEFRFEVEEETSDLKGREESLIAEYCAVECGFNVLRTDEEFCRMKYRPRKDKPVKKEKPVKEKKERKITFGWLKSCKTAKKWASKYGR